MLGAVAAAVALLAASPVQGSVFGPIVSTSGTTFTITTSLSPNGRSVVSAGSARITEEVTAPRAALAVGACVMANGARTSAGVVSAVRIAISAPVSGKCGAGFGGRFGRVPGGARPPRVNGGSPPAGGLPRPGNFGFAFGRVTRLSGSVLTVEGTDFLTKKATKTSVHFSAKTTLSETKIVETSAVQTKMCAFVRGTSTDKGKSVKATDVSLTPERGGTCTTRFRRPGG